MTTSRNFKKKDWLYQQSNSKKWIETIYWIVRSVFKNRRIWFL